MALNSFAILNEETVIALCFLSFMKFTFHFFGSSIQDSLDERRVTLKEEFRQALIKEREFCQQSIYETEMPLSKMKALLTLAAPLIEAKLSWYQEAARQTLPLVLQKNLKDQVELRFVQSLAQLDSSRAGLEEQVSQFMATQLKTAVHAQFQKNLKQFQNKFIAQAIVSLKRTRL